MSHPDSPERSCGQVQEPAAPAVPAEVSSKSLFREQREIIILHGDDRYRLRITANDKLILTK